jgi:hypothetical protein
MIIHWPDKFYHTSEDTPEKVSPDSLARSGALAAIYAYWLASAGAAEAEWLGHWMVARFGAWAAHAAAKLVESTQAAPSDEARRGLWRRYARLSAFRCERLQAALGDLAAIDAGVADRLPAWRARLIEIERSEREWATHALGRGAEATSRRDAGVGSDTEPAWLAQAKTLYPCRQGPGPIDIAMVLRADHPERMRQLWELSERMGDVAHNLEPVLQYWADGTRSVAEIAELAALELDIEPAETALVYFELLAETGLVRLESRPVGGRA